MQAPWAGWFADLGWAFEHPVRSARCPPCPCPGRSRRARPGALRGIAWAWALISADSVQADAADHGASRPVWIQAPARALAGHRLPVNRVDLGGLIGQQGVRVPRLRPVRSGYWASGRVETGAGARSISRGFAPSAYCPCTRTAGSVPSARRAPSARIVSLPCSAPHQDIGRGSRCGCRWPSRPPDYRSPPVRPAAVHTPVPWAAFRAELC